MHIKRDMQYSEGSDLVPTVWLFVLSVNYFQITLI